MNGIQSIHFKNFETPPLESIWATKSVVFLALNIFTLGIYGAAESISRKYYIKELKIIQMNLQQQANQIASEWEELENKFTGLLKKMQSGNLDGSSLKKEIQQFSLDQARLKRQKIQADYEVSPSISEVALGTIAFIGNLFLNIATVGLYGVYQNYALKNKIIILEAENDHIQTQFDSQVANKEAHLDQVSKLSKEFVDQRNELDTLETTDTAKEHKKYVDAQQQLSDLTKKQKQLESDLVDLKAQKLKAQNLEQEVKNLRTDKDNAHRLADMRKQESDQKSLEIQNLKAARAKDVATLQSQLTIAESKAKKVQSLEQEVSKLKQAASSQPELAKLAAQVGPVAPLYTPRQDEDGIIAGSVEAIQDDPDDIIQDPNSSNSQIELAKHKQRYESKRSAAAIIEASFDYAFKTLLDMAENGDKIKLNDSMQTPQTPGAYSIYKYMLLDIIKGAGVGDNGCHGFKLTINEHVSMLPSQPEKIIHSKMDYGTKKLKPEVTLHYGQMDDFTPTPEELKVTAGVDAVSVKWIWEQLSDEAREVLTTRILSDLIPNDHVDYKKAQTYLKNPANAQQAKLINIAEEILSTMAVGLNLKFGTNVLSKCWLEVVDTTDADKKPFIKAEDHIDVSKIEDIVRPKVSNQPVEWKLDKNVLSCNGTQPEFFDLISKAQLKYQIAHNCMSEDLVMSPADQDDEYRQVKWDDINPQYHVSHIMVDADPVTYLGGERCLFSNLLAIFLTDKKDVTKANIEKLRKAMSAYLDTLKIAKQKWSHIKDQPVKDPETQKLKDLAELADFFEKEIRSVNKCTVANYQEWLKKTPGYENLVDVSNLTQLEIQIAAYTLGVKIGILGIYDPKRPKASIGAKVDEHGKIVPLADYNGPNTSECFMMASTNGSYYGLFPKLDIGQVIDDLEQAATRALTDLSDYWTSIDMNKNP